MQNFDIYFSGKLLADASPEKARIAIGKLFKVGGQALERLFSGQAIRIKKDVDVEAANRFRAAFRNAGALVDIVPHGQQPHTDKPTPNTNAPDKAQMILLPANTGSLEDCAAPVEAPAIPDISGIALDSNGTTLDQSPPPASLEINTNAISMQEANTGSLADCKPPKKTVKIPDISHIQLSDEIEN